MQINVIDADGAPQVVIWQAPGTPTSRSGVIGADPSQTLMDANSERSGWLFQNKGQAPMYLNDIGGVAGPNDPDSFVILPGQTFPPLGYAVSVDLISVAGTQGDAFAAREF